MTAGAAARPNHAGCGINIRLTTLASRAKTPTMPA